MKTLLITFLFLNSAMADDFNSRLNDFLNKKYLNFVIKCADKLKVSSEELKKRISKKSLEESILINGEIDSIYGICSLKGTINFIDSNISVRCISEELNGKIIFI